MGSDGKLRNEGSGSKRSADDKPKRSWLKILIAAVLAFAVLLTVAAVVVWRMLPELVLREVVQQADARGIELDACEIDLHWDLPNLDGVTLEQCQFVLARAPYVTGQVESVKVDLVDFEPRSATVRGADVVVRGVPKLNEILEEQRPATDGIRVKVVESRLRWFAVDTEVPRLALAGLTYDSDSGDFSSQVEVEGTLEGTASRRGSLLQAELNLINHPGAKLSAKVEQDKGVAEVRTEFNQLALSELHGPLLQIPEDLRKVKVDAQFYAELPLGLAMNKPKGDLRATLHGLNFPVPRELAGLVYGTPAEFSTEFALDRSLTRVNLSKLEFKVGALRMTGDGKVELEGAGLAFEMAMSGNLSCAAIVRSATAVHAGSELAEVAGRIAKRSLDGSVKLIAFVSGHTSNLAEAKVIKSVGLGCGLKPELVDELADLPARLLKQLPDLSDLPGVPKTDPGKPPKFQLPKLPKLPFPGDKKRARDPGEPETEPAPREDLTTPPGSTND